MTQLSENISLAEMTRSSTASRKKIKNKPSGKQTQRLRNLAKKGLQPIRDQFGIVKVSSGFRSPELNEAIGGAEGSRHLSGEAADFEVPGVDNLVVFTWIIEESGIKFDECYLEFYVKGDPSSGWIHLAIACNGNHQGRIN